jgi:hypothetical protein
MGCCESNEPFDLCAASEQQLWAALQDISSETGFRVYGGADTGNASGQGQKAYEVLSELNRRYLYSWDALEKEMRKRDWYIWLYRIASLGDDGWDDEGEQMGGPVIAVLLGGEREALAKRELHARAGVPQDFT